MLTTSPRQARWWVVLVLVGAAALLAGCDDGTEPTDEAAGEGIEPDVPEEVHYVALGDSIAAGTSAGTTYVDLYAGWFAEETGSQVTVDNAAVSGWTSDDLLAALRDDHGVRTAVERADLVTLNIGGNDLLRPLRLVVEGRCGGDDGYACLRDAVPALLERWDDLLDELLALTDGEVARLRTMDLYGPRALDQQPDAVRAVLDEYLEEVNERLREAADDRGIPVAAVHEAFREDAPAPRDDRLLSDDGIHPSPEGHARIAEALAELGTALDGGGA